VLRYRQRYYITGQGKATNIKVSDKRAEVVFGKTSWQRNVEIWHEIGDMRHDAMTRLRALRLGVGEQRYTRLTSVTPNIYNPAPPCSEEFATSICWKTAIEGRFSTRFRMTDGERTDRIVLLIDARQFWTSPSLWFFHVGLPTTSRA
jgi:hypothetical protein